MLGSNSARICGQVRFLQRQFLQDGELPFTDVLSAKAFSQALTTAEVVWKDRIYTPLVTLWVFLTQVLSANHSCRGAVARLIAHRISCGEEECSADTGAYCQARRRLPEEFVSAVACQVGRNLDARAESDWLWKGRRVYMFDGSTVSSQYSTKPVPCFQSELIFIQIHSLSRIFHESVGPNKQTLTAPELRSQVRGQATGQSEFNFELRLRCSGSALRPRCRPT